MASRRRNARIVVMQTLFEQSFPGREEKLSDEEILKRNINEFEKGHVDDGFAESLLEGILENKNDITDLIKEHAPQWPLERMDAIARSLLILGTYELAFAKEAPAAVVMDEAIEIAKEFGEEETGKFVNGVLNAVAHADSD